MLNSLVNEILQFVQYECRHGDRKRKTFRVLLAVAKGATKILNGAAKENPELARDFAANEFWWPTMVGPRKKDREQAGEFHEEMGLAKGLLKKTSRKGVDLQAVSTRTAARLLEYLGRIRAVEPVGDHEEVFPSLPEGLRERIINLPDFEEGEAAEKWFQAAWQVLMHFTDREPQKREDLWPLGKDRIKKVMKEERMSEDEISVERKNQEVRTGIKNALRQAIRGLSKSFCADALVPNRSNANLYHELRQMTR